MDKQKGFIMCNGGFFFALLDFTLFPENPVFYS